ncbi:MAG: hypothetical protein JWM56_1359 [Candidatus Peribacteria bacterium]|nr:hypothetical protein [Candidatus Peribacteria bacterium]
MNSISLAALRQRQRELDQIIDKARKEKEHIEYVIKNFVKKEDIQMSLPDPLFTFASRGELLELVTSILQQNGNTMKAGDIYTELQRRGVAPKKTTFDAYMSQWSGDPAISIHRLRPGMYKLHA